LRSRTSSPILEQVDADQERQALAAVEQNLRQRFPDIDPTLVEAAVRVSHAELTGPIRDFVPLLVERAARDRLAYTTRETPEPPNNLS
jgi:hypothetical protein